MSTTIGSTITAAELRALFGDRAEPAIAILDVDSIKEHGDKGLLRQAIERVIEESRPALSKLGHSDRPQTVLRILKNNPEYWGLPSTVRPNSRTIRMIREVLNANQLGNPKLY